MQATDPNAPLLRMYYLQQLGITCYVPRAPLPGALAEAMPEESADELPETLPDETTPARMGEATVLPPAALDSRIGAETSARAPAPPAGIRPATARVMVEETASPSLSPHKLAAAAQPIVAAASPFQILFAVVDTELAVAMQIPSAMTPVLRDADARLLANVLRWLGVAWPTQAPLLQFRWPLPGQPAAGLEEAGRGLQAFLQQAALEQPFQRLLVFGSEPEQALRACNGVQQEAWQSWYTHSLTQLLALPSLKHETWQTLLPLRAQLTS